MEVTEMCIFVFCWKQWLILLYMIRDAFHNGHSYEIFLLK